MKKRRNLNQHTLTSRIDDITRTVADTTLVPQHVPQHVFQDVASFAIKSIAVLGNILIRIEKMPLRNSNSGFLNVSTTLTVSHNVSGSTSQMLKTTTTTATILALTKLLTH